MKYTVLKNDDIHPPMIYQQNGINMKIDMTKEQERRTNSLQLSTTTIVVSFLLDMIRKIIISYCNDGLHI